MLNLTNKKNLNEAIVSAVQKNWYGGAGEERDYSVTQLLNPPKIYHLMNRHADKIEEDVSERIFMLMGSAMHVILERANEHDVEFLILSRVRDFFERVRESKVIREPTQLTEEFVRFVTDERFNLGGLLSLLNEERYLIEKRFKYVTQSGKIIAGGIDLYDKQTRVLHDYKFSSIWTWIYRKRPGNRTEEWTQQLNMYRLFLERQGYPVDKICINLIMRDYSKSKARFEADYPEPIETLELPLLGLDVVEEMIERRIAEIEKYTFTQDDGIPVCTPNERWQQQDTWAVYRGDNKTASKVEYSYAGAKNWMEKKVRELAERDIAKGMDVVQATQKVAGLFRIEKRPGIPTRCVSYCPVAPFCNFYRSLPDEVKEQ